MNAYTCELCGKRPYPSETAVVRTPFYFAVLDGPDDDAWGKHSNEAKYCDKHVEDYEWWPFQSDLRPRRIEDSPRSQAERAVIAICEERRIADDVEPDYYFARRGA